MGKHTGLWQRLAIAGLLLVILGSIGVIVAKDRVNGQCRWEIWLSSDDTRTVRQPVTWAGFTQRVQVVGQRAWRAVWPEKKQAKGKVETMAAYTATGAGIGAADGLYSAITGGYSNGTWYLYYHVGAATWAIGTVLGEDPASGHVAYAAAGDPGTVPLTGWGVHGAYSPDPSPAPTLAAVGTPFPGDWPWPWWDDSSPFFGANTPIAPCAATLAGTAYLVLPSNDAVGAVYGFELFNLTTKTFAHVAAAGALFPPGGYDPYQTAACFDVGDGVHIWLFSGVWMDGAIPKFTCAKWSVVPGGAATLISTQDVALDTQDITLFVEVSAGNYRFVLMDTDHLHYCTYAAGASSYTAGDPIALPALPGTYTDRRCGAGETGPKDQVLFVRGATTYWMRHAQNVAGEDRIFVYSIAAGVVTPLADVLAVQFRESALNYTWRQAWGNDPVRDCALGDLGPPVNTVTGVATERWTPGSNGIPHFTFATYPAQERWYIVAGGVLYVMGWCDENYDHQPFVLDTTPIPTIIENVDGTARGVGEATLQSLTPVDLTGEGIARGVGEATLRAATLLVPAAGIARGVGEVTLGASYNITAEGPGGRSDLILTPGVWPGAERRVTIPSFFDRMSNRRYGGALGTARPPWYAGIDTGNPLAQYAKFWSWCVEDAADDSLLSDASDVMGDGVLSVILPYGSCLVSGGPSGYDQTYTALLSNGMGNGRWDAADAIGYLQSPVSYPGSWTLRSADGTVLDTSEAGWGYVDPWDATWPSGLVIAPVSGDAAWANDGLLVRSILGSPGSTKARIDLPSTDELPDLSTWVFDFTPYDYPISGSMWGEDATLMQHYASLGGAVETQVELTFKYQSTVATWLHLAAEKRPGGLWDERINFPWILGTRYRIVVSIQFGTQADVYVNGSLLGTMPIGSQQPGTRVHCYLGILGLAVYSMDGYGPLPATVHEVGFLSGYAATAADVATNPMFVMPYGLRGSPTPVTDRA